MTPLFVKICGITRREDAEFAGKLPVDALGFIGFKGSPRFIRPSAVREISSGLKCEIRKVGVFVNASIPEIREYIDAGIDTVQLHGDESPEFALEIAKFAEVWKAIGAKDRAEIEKYGSFPASKFLVDAFSAEARGGTGKQVDRGLAKFAAAILPAPLILAGGLNPENIAEIISEVKPFGVDVNSGVESSPGVKDHSKVKKLFSELEKFRKQV